MDLLAAEITARTARTRASITAISRPSSARRTTRASTPRRHPSRRRGWKTLARGGTAATLAGEPITGKLTRAPGNGAPIGGLKVVAANGWFAARPSGTENVYKIYAESFKDEAHLNAIVSEAAGDCEQSPGRPLKKTHMM